MKRQLTPAALKRYVEAPLAVQKAFDKQVKLLVENLRHPSLRDKKYDEKTNIWEARINRDWRFYFVIAADTYVDVWFDGATRSRPRTVQVLAIRSRSSLLALK